MPDPELARMLSAAGSLVLRAPTPELLTILAESEGLTLELDRARQDFYDVLCVPQSGRYVPPYAHVLAAGRVNRGGAKVLWNFPPPRYDGGDALARWYDAVGFEPLTLDADPMLRGPHRPLDTIGYILTYMAGLVASRDVEVVTLEQSDAIIVTFLAQHVDPWADRFCELLASCESPYLRTVAQAVHEVVETLRACYPDRQAAAPSLHTFPIPSVEARQ